MYRITDYRQNEMKYKGEKHRGPGHQSPYPISRQSPSIELVELAKEVADADDLLTIQAVGKLRVLAEQIEQLRKKARDILAETRRNQELHRAGCRFNKRIGSIYHLYSKSDESLFFSMIDPVEWGNSPRAVDLRFLGSYRLENDRSWTPVDTEHPGTEWSGTENK